MIILCLFFVILLVLGIIYFYPSKPVEDDNIIFIKYSDYIDEYNTCISSVEKKKETLKLYHYMSSSQISYVRLLDEQYNNIVKRFLNIHKTAIVIVKRNAQKRPLSLKEKDKLKEYLVEMDDILNEFTELICKYEDILEEIKKSEKINQQNEKEQKNEQDIKIQPRSENGFGFFDGCNSQDSLDKRYKALCKIYHPDNANGDEEVFKCIVNEYECIRKEMVNNSP